MENNVMEYQCPCCTAGLKFGGDTQQLTCEYCGTTFEQEAVKAFNEERCKDDSGEFEWENAADNRWSEEDADQIRGFSCPACAGEIITDAHTAAIFCPYCGNPAILPTRLSGGLKPDGVLPFKTTKEDAKEAFLALCKGKPLLPKFFTKEQQLEKITGMYVPFWLYDCSGSFDGSYKATRIHCWSDTNYNYTKTDHYLVERQADAEFHGIPMDGSSKMDDTFMESIEPFDYTDLQPFQTSYLSGYFADKYDVPWENGQERIRQRVNNTMEGRINQTLVGYATTIPTGRNLKVSHSKAQYVLLPVWMLNTNYKGKTYTFAMNGQTGKMTGTLPTDPKRAWGWFAGVSAVAMLVTTLVQLLSHL